MVGTLGLALFLYAVGIQYGRQFFVGLTSASGLKAKTHIKDTARRNPVVGRLIIIGTVLTIIAAFIASVLTIIDKVIDLKAKFGN